MLSAQTDAQEMPETVDSVYMVHTAFGSTAQDDLLGGISVVNVEDMLNINYTTEALDDMESLIGGWNGKSIWGMDEDNYQGYLVFIDGIPRDVANVKPSEIAEMTFLKGANAVVLYGSRAAKGAILITTKRGKASEELKIDLRVNAGFDVIKRLPEFLNSADYMRYYNQACDNDGKKHTYSDEDIDKYASGKNPYHYTDMDYYSSDYIRKVRGKDEMVLELSGGNKRARLYGNINAQTEGDFVKAGDAKKNRTNRISFRGNVDIDFNDYISGHVDANATFKDEKHRQYSNKPEDRMTYWKLAATQRPNFPSNAAQLIPVSLISEDATQALTLIGMTDNIFDGCFLGGASDYYCCGSASEARTPLGQIYAGGEMTTTSRQFQFDGGLNFDLRKVLEGLSVKTNFGMDFKALYNVHFNPKYAVFQPTWSEETNLEDEKIIDLRQISVDEITGNKELWGTQESRTLALSFQFDYDRSFGLHNVSAKVIGHGFQQTKEETYHKTSNVNLGFDVNYNYDHKYYLHFSSALVHSSKLAPGHRNEFAPTLTLGWNLAKESFLDGSIFDDLLLSASASQLSEDIDIDGFYKYLGTWESQGTAEWGDTKSTSMSRATGGENRNIEMIKRKEFTVSLKTAMFDKLVTTEFTFFKNRMEGYLIAKTKLWPSHMDGINAPLNNDINGRVGFDFAVNVNKKVSDVDLSVGLVGSYYDTKVIKKEQIDLPENQPQLDKEDRPIDAIYGYKNDGYFMSAEEAAAANQSVAGGKLRAGDIKYKDLSEGGEGNGVVDKNDKVYLGKEGKFGSPFVMGVNVTAKYKNFTFFALGTAKAGAYAKKNNAYYQPKTSSKYSEIVKDTWTPDNLNAKYPALTTGAGANNYVESDFWMYKNNKFVLSKIQITYDLPQEILGDSFVKGLSAFVSGKDLLTISKESKVMETTVDAEPQTRFFNVGVKATF
jgi:TonB-linked SusC/RagA family outer membrane protein